MKQIKETIRNNKKILVLISAYVIMVVLNFLTPLIADGICIKQVVFRLFYMMNTHNI